MTDNFKVDFSICLVWDESTAWGQNILQNFYLCDLSQGRQLYYERIYGYIYGRRVHIK